MAETRVLWSFSRAEGRNVAQLRFLLAVLAFQLYPWNVLVQYRCSNVNRFRNDIRCLLHSLIEEE